MEANNIRGQYRRQWVEYVYGLGLVSPKRYANIHNKYSYFIPVYSQ